MSRPRAFVILAAFALCACAPPPIPTPDAQPDASSDASADAQSAPDAEPGMDASTDATPDVVSLPDATPEASSPDVVDAGAPDARADASAAPDINVRHDTMAVAAALRLTCGPGMPSAGAAGFCDAVKSETFEGACSVRGTRYQVAFSPFNCGLACYSIGAAEDGALRTVTLSTGGAPISGTNIVVTRGLEWVDGMGQRRQNFYARVQLDPTPARDIRGIAGVAGVTLTPEYADVYALGCPKGP